MLNSRKLQKTLVNNIIQNQNASRSRSRSIYRGNQLHTTSMHLKIECDMSLEKLNQTKDQMKETKLLFKQNRTQKLKDSLKIVEGTHSGKKVVREENSEKANKNLFFQGRQLQTERFLKESTNIQSQLKKQNSLRPDKSTIMLGGSNTNQKNIQVNPNPLTTLLSAQRNNKKQNIYEAEQQQKIIVSEQQLRELYFSMAKLQQQNNKLRKQISILMDFPKSSVVRALSFRQEMQ